jgi:hypothetical protein
VRSAGRDWDSAAAAVDIDDVHNTHELITGKAFFFSFPRLNGNTPQLRIKDTRRPNTHMILYGIKASHTGDAQPLEFATAAVPFHAMAASYLNSLAGAVMRRSRS